MKFLFALALLAVSQAHVIKQSCDIIPIQGINYQMEVLKENVYEPYQMAIDFNTNTLFFSYSGPKSETEEDVFTHKSAYLNLNNNEFNIILGINDGFAATVDNNKHKVYLGGSDGIYEYDYETKKAVHVDPKGYSIWQLFSKDKLYYTAYPQERVYTFEGGNSVLVPELQRTMVKQVFLDNDNNIYFSNSSGLYCLNNSDKEIVKLGEYTINSFTADKNGNLYFATPIGLYSIDNNQNVKKLLGFYDMTGLVVDANDNFIFGGGYTIFRLSKTNSSCS